MPTLSRDDKEYGKPSFVQHDGQIFPPYCYWRGTIWPPTNYLVYEGLKRYGLDETAAELAEKSTALWWKTWKEKGWACENYYPNNGERSKMAQEHQSWAMLLPLIGVKEMIDVEWWNGPKSIRFGTMSPTNNEISNVYIANTKFSLKQSDNKTEVYMNEKLLLKANSGKIIIRDFKIIGKKFHFEIKTINNIIMTVYSPNSSAKKNFNIKAGKQVLDCEI